jgi:hypothetical protein
MTTYNINTKIPRLSCALHDSLKATRLYLPKMEANEAVAIKETLLDQGGNGYFSGRDLCHLLTAVN